MADVIAAFVTLIVGYGVCCESKHRSNKRSVFMLLCIATFFAVVADALTWVSFVKQNYIFEYSLTIFTFLTPFICMGLFALYIENYFLEKANISSIHIKGLIFYMTICMILSAIGCLHGDLFSIKNGVYKTEHYYEIYLLAYVFALIYNGIIICFHGKKVGAHDTIAALIFVTLPIVGLVINIFNPSFEYNIAIIAIDVLIIYVMLQSEHEDVLRKRGDDEYIKAHYDELTGLRNRLAYSEVCDSAVGDKKVGVIFSDINGLKYANDHYGHKEGDKLICLFSQMLLTCFRKEDIFRISGDEFVVIIKDIPKLEFDARTKSLYDMIKLQSIPIACMGSVHGSESELMRLVDIAEKEMYEGKKKFYKKYPDYARV